MAYLNTIFEAPGYEFGFEMPFVANMPEVSRTFELKESDRDAVLSFLDEKPPHGAAMASFIYDNGIESPLNRGTFYGYHDRFGDLEGVALIGHTTLLDVRSSEALKALAFVARQNEAKMHVIVSEGTAALDFWTDAVRGATAPRQVSNEYLFEVSFPYSVRECEFEVRLARPEELMPIAEAHAEVAFLESGDDPMLRDREGFLTRVMRRIEQGRIFVVFEDGKLLFKADVAALATDTAHLEGVYVNADRRGEGIGPSCLSEVTRRLLNTVQTVCLLSNIDFTQAHKSFMKAGYKKTKECTAVFV